MATPNDAKEFAKAPARMTVPPAPPITLSEKLAALAQPKKVATLWLQAEIRKLIPVAQRLEAPKGNLVLGGVGVGIIIGLTLGWYVGLW